MVVSRTTPSRQTRAQASPYNLRPVRSSCPSSSSDSSPSSSSTSLSSPRTSGSGSDTDDSLHHDVRATRFAISKVTDFLEKHVTKERSDFSKEKAKLVKAKNQAEKDRDAIAATLANLKKDIDKFIASKDEAITCSICTMCMERLFTIVECNHTFCYDCLRQWFQSSLSEQLKYRDVPEEHAHPPYTAQTLEFLFQQAFIHVLLYKCPLCRSSVRKRPVEVPLLKDLVAVISTTLGPPKEPAIVNPHLEDDDIWAGVFRA
ncbi:hypothetical protein BV22DRAFT_1051387 [Leucogyrophana mollusca]|uniref:Uncharacterized protein n=1 Tax=Leucogyrophana mollusca TaxID=85980 RepID=A0ACB8AZY0_9AGAM|nr:hypothetical protein BV22DRAFT_1051387 [Leucogyrophana mollusca]